MKREMERLEIPDKMIVYDNTDLIEELIQVAQKKYCTKEKKEEYGQGNNSEEIR